MLDEQATNAISSVSKWVPEWSIDELKAHESKDPDIKEMISWIQTNTLPKPFPEKSVKNSKHSGANANSSKLSKMVFCTDCGKMLEVEEAILNSR